MGGWVHTQDAEASEMVLEAKRAAKLAEQAELAARLADMAAALDAKQVQGDAAASRRTALLGELETMLAEQQSPFREALKKTFLRRIKRSSLSHNNMGGPGNCTAASGGSNGSSNGDDGDSDGDGCYSDSDDNCEEEVCPPGCDPVLYERVVELRERRLDEDDEIAEVARAVEAIRKEREMLSKKARVLETGLAGINQVRHGD